MSSMDKCFNWNINISFIFWLFGNQFFLFPTTYQGFCFAIWWAPKFCYFCPLFDVFQLFSERKRVYGLLESNELLNWLQSRLVEICPTSKEYQGCMNKLSKSCNPRNIMKIPLRETEGSYTPTPLRRGGNLCNLIGVRSFPLV